MLVVIKNAQRSIAPLLGCLPTGSFCILTAPAYEVLGGIRFCLHRRRPVTTAVFCCTPAAITFEELRDAPLWFHLHLKSAWLLHPLLLPVPWCRAPFIILHHLRAPILLRLLSGLVRFRFIPTLFPSAIGCPCACLPSMVVGCSVPSIRHFPPVACHLQALCVGVLVLHPAHLFQHNHILYRNSIICYVVRKQYPFPSWPSISTLMFPKTTISLPFPSAVIPASYNNLFSPPVPVPRWFVQLMRPAPCLPPFCTTFCFSHVFLRPHCYFFQPRFILYGSLSPSVV